MIAPLTTHPSVFLNELIPERRLAPRPDSLIAMYVSVLSANGSQRPIKKLSDRLRKLSHGLSFADQVHLIGVRNQRGIIYTVGAIGDSRHPAELKENAGAILLQTLPHKIEFIQYPHIPQGISGPHNYLESNYSSKLDLIVD